MRSLHRRLSGVHSYTEDDDTVFQVTYFKELDAACDGLYGAILGSHTGFKAKPQLWKEPTYGVLDGNLLALYEVIKLDQEEEVMF